MTDDHDERGPVDRTRINLSDPSEVRFWSDELAVTADALERIIAKVGPMVDDVRRHMDQ